MNKNAFQAMTSQSEVSVVVDLPEAEGATHGLLRFDAETGIELEVGMPTLSTRGWFESRDARYPVLHGVTEVAKPFTLVDCWVQRSSGGVGGFVTRTIRSNRLLMGTHLSSPSARVVDEISIRMDVADQWTAVSPIRESESSVRANSDQREFMLVATSQSLFAFSASTTGLGLIGQQRFQSSGGATHWSREFRVQSWFRIRPRHPIDEDAAATEIFKLQSLLSLLYGRQAFVEEIQLLVQQESGASDPGLPVHYLARFPQPPKNVAFAPAMLPFPIVRDQLGEIWAAWDRRFDQFKTAVELISGPQLFRGQLLEFQLLAIMQGIETLHRSTHDGCYLPVDEYRSVYDCVRSAIPKKIPRGLHDALKSRLQYGNEYSLRRRLEELWDGLPANVASILHPRPKWFLKRLVQTRNYLTHYDNSIEAESFRGPDLYFAALIARWIVTATLLVEIGVDPDCLANALKQDRSLAHAVEALGVD